MLAFQSLVWQSVVKTMPGANQLQFKGVDGFAHVYT